jgi:hypothetical protein
MIPFIWQIFYCEDAWSVRLVVSICMVTQVCFFLLEVVQMCIKGREYFEFWNLVDCLLFGVFTVYYIARMGNTDPLMPRQDTRDGTPRDGTNVHMVTTYAITHTVILVFGSMKIMNFLRVFDAFGQFVQLLQQVVKDVTVFTAFFFYWVILNSYMFDILGVDYEDEDYDHLGRGFYYFIQTFRNALGDIAVP